MAKNKEKILEIVRYLIVGVLTTIVSLVIYYGLTKTVLNPNNAFELQTANVISWIISVAFAYITNRVFVFKSKNKKKLKEITTFVGSRLLTLFLDMAIMFLGVTILKISDLLIKLASQGIVIIANYLLSKLVVFKEKKVVSKNSQRKRKIINILIFLGPVIYLVNSIFQSEITKWISICYLMSIGLFMMAVLLKEKKYCGILIAILGYLLIQHLYIYCQQLDLQTESIFLINTFLFPISLLYFYQQDTLETEKNITQLFFLYIFVILIQSCITDIPKIYQNPIIGILIAFLPIALKKIHNHQNQIAQTLGLALILLTMFILNIWLFSLVFVVLALYILIKERKKLKKQNKIVFAILIMIGILSTCRSIMNENITIENLIFENRQQQLVENKEKFKNANIEEQLFGITPIKEIEVQTIQMDFCDILFRVGWIGFVLYLILWSYTLIHIRMTSYKRLGFILAILASFFLGSILTSGYALLAISVLASKTEKKQKKILLVSNMYPSRKYKHYGSFVKNVSISLEDLGFQVDRVTKKKQITFLGKFVGYSIMYLKAIYKSIFNSYDYIYVHFISQSAFCVLLGKKTSKDTKLILNVHGNDIVPDYDFEQKNVRRSKFVLPYADLIIAPSEYFEEVLMSDYQIPKEKIKIYPSGGVDKKTFFPKNQIECKKELELEENITYFGFVSRIEKNKGWDTLLNALNELNKGKSLKNTKVLFIGAGSEQKEFDNLVKKYHLEDIIIQKKFVLQKDLVNYYNAMDLFIFPTKRKSESLGLVGLEAMACKTFVIGCTLYGPREYLKNKKNSLTFLKENELKAKIKEFQKMPSKEKERIKENALLTVEKYNQELLQEKLTEIFY